MSLRLLITGCNGQVGWHLQRTLAPMGEVTAIDIEQVDLTDARAVSRTVREIAPDIVVNAAAYTAVDKAESEPELARAINVSAPAQIAEECSRSGALLVHYSTDYVYDGSKQAPYEERDATGPLSLYGQTKLAGDQAIQASGCAHIILRTTWVYDIRGKNFLRTVIRLAQEKEELRIVGDQYGAPTWARGLAEATTHHPGPLPGTQERNREVAHRHLPSHRRRADIVGGFCASDSGRLCAFRPADGSGEFGAPLKTQTVSAITTEEYPTPARRPRNSVLSNAQVQTAFGIVMPDWRDQLRLAMQDALRR